MDVKNIKNSNYSFQSWIPQTAISSLKELRHDASLKSEDFRFIAPIFESPDLKAFFGRFSDRDRYFFYDLFYRLIRARS